MILDLGSGGGAKDYFSSVGVRVNLGSGRTVATTKVMFKTAPSLLQSDYYISIFAAQYPD